MTKTIMRIQIFGYSARQLPFKKSMSKNTKKDRDCYSCKRLQPYKTTPRDDNQMQCNTMTEPRIKK